MVEAGEPTECFNPDAAVMPKEGHVGAVAFSRTGDPGYAAAHFIYAAQMRLVGYTLKEKVKITAGAVSAVLIVGLFFVFALAILSTR
jgi:hypothetical protein